jgi:hypothetical protein
MIDFFEKISAKTEVHIVASRSMDDGSGTVTVVKFNDRARNSGIYLMYIGNPHGKVELITYPLELSSGLSEYDEAMKDYVEAEISEVGHFDVECGSAWSKCCRIL